MNKKQFAYLLLGTAFFWPTFRKDGIGLLFNEGGIGTLYEARLYYLLFLLFVASSSIAIIFNRTRMSNLFSEKQAVVLGCSLLATAGAALLATAPMLGSPRMAVACLALLAYAFWFALIVPAWGYACMRFEGPSPLLPLFLGFLLGLALSSLCLVPGLLHLSPIAGPVASGTFWLLFMKSSMAHQCVNPDFALRDIPLKQVALLTLFLLAGGIIRGFLNKGVIGSDPSADLLVTHGITVVATVAVMVVSLTQESASAMYRKVWALLALLLFGGLFLAAFVSAQAPSSTSFARSLIIAGRTCFSLFLWIVLSLTVMQKRTDPIMLFSLFYVLGETLSSFSSYLLVPAFAEFLHVSLSDQLLLFSLIIAFMLLSASFVFLGGPFTHAPVENRPTALDLCRSISARFGLTERETEIIALVSQGHSLKKIASLLYLSPHTVQSYSKSAYKKLGIHKKQDVIDFVAELKRGFDLNEP